jgi:hypothetical protein
LFPSCSLSVPITFPKGFQVIPPNVPTSTTLFSQMVGLPKLDLSCI